MTDTLPAITLPDDGEWFHIEGRGNVYASVLPHKIQERDALNGRTVEVRGELYTIMGLELFMHAAPWHAGEKAGFLLAPLTKGLE